jgi:hypothetical protein
MAMDSLQQVRAEAMEALKRGTTPLDVARSLRLSLVELAEIAGADPSSPLPELPPQRLRQPAYDHTASGAGRRMSTSGQSNLGVTLAG